jgi:hypothetical protein
MAKKTKAKTTKAKKTKAKKAKAKTTKAKTTKAKKTKAKKTTPRDQGEHSRTLVEGTPPLKRGPKPKFNGRAMTGRERMQRTRAGAKPESMEAIATYAARSPRATNP